MSTQEQAPALNKLARLPQTFVEAAIDFEKSKIEEIKRSRKIAWIIASVATVICSVSILAFLVALLTRSEPEPTILQVDKSTGATTVLRSVRDTNHSCRKTGQGFFILPWPAIHVPGRAYTLG